MVSLAVEDMDFVRILIGPGDPKVILVAIFALPMQRGAIKMVGVLGEALLLIFGDEEHDLVLSREREDSSRDCAEAAATWCEGSGQPAARSPPIPPWGRYQFNKRRMRENHAYLRGAGYRRPASSMNIEHPTSNIQHPTSNGGGAGKDTRSHPEATPRPPSGHLVANW